MFPSYYTYTTLNGSRLRIDRVHRSYLDSFIINNPPPQPPDKEIEVWGGEIERIPDFDDPGFQNEYLAYVVEHRIAILELIRPAITIQFVSDADQQSITDFNELEDQNYDALTVVLMDDKELDRVAESVFYLSTVTPRGVEMALRLLNVSWLGIPVENLVLPGTYAKRAQYFEDWSAAIYCNHTWQSFCNLTGPEQSQCVAFYRSQTTINWKISNPTVS